MATVYQGSENLTIHTSFPVSMGQGTCSSKRRAMSIIAFISVYKWVKRTSVQYDTTTHFQLCHFIRQACSIWFPWMIFFPWKGITCMFINLCSKYWVCARLWSFIGTTGIKKTLKGLILWGKKAGKQPEEAKLFRVMCAMEKQNLSRGHGGAGALLKEVDTWGRGKGGCQVSFSTRPPFPGSVCTRALTTPPSLLSSVPPLPPQQQGSSGQHDLCVTSVSGTWGSRQGRRVWFHRHSHWQKWESPRNWLWLALYFVMSVNASYLILRAVCF